MKRTFGACALALAGALLLTGAPTLAQEAINQIQLTAKQIESFIAAQKDIAAITGKLGELRPEQQPDAKTKSALDGVAKKYGFKDFSDYDDVSTNIGMVLSGFDPKTKAFLSPPEMLKKQIAETTADKTIPPAEKAKLLEELNDSLKSAQPVKYPDNIKLVEKYYDRLDAIMK
jgi:hypothetical protein